MKIVQLHAENFKRLGVVEITPEGNLVTIGGKNGHGKSSVLDAIYVALKGRAVAPPKPIRKGEEACTIRLDMGDLIVTRKFIEQEGGKPYTDSIKVEDAQGRRYGKPQEVLNELLGEVGFDPFEFVNMKPKEQANRLLEMVPLTIDLDEFREADASDFANRTDVNRDVTRLRAQLEGIPKEEVPEDVPDRAAIADALGNAADTNTRISNERQRRETEKGTIARMYGERDNKRARAEQLREEAAELDAAADAINTEASDRETKLNALKAIPEFVDTDELRQQLRDAEAQQAVVDRQARRKAIADELAAAEAKSKGFSDALAERAKERNAALAEAEMPVPGLAFAIDEKGDATLTYEGLPFDKDQISTAVQLRVSTAIGMAANPQLRVLRIMDGSLLDEDSMRMLAEMADAEDFQLWVEVVGDGGVGIVMENGLVRGEPEPEPEAEAAAPAKKSRAKPKADDKPDGALI